MMAGCAIAAVLSSSPILPKLTAVAVGRAPTPRPSPSSTVGPIPATATNSKLNHDNGGGYCQLSGLRTSVATSAISFSTLLLAPVAALASGYAPPCSHPSADGFLLLAVADASLVLEPGLAGMLVKVLGPLFAAFNFLLVVRIVMSWYPQLPVRKLPFSIAYVPTEPLLGPTRRLIQPVGGVDVAPVIWVALISFTNEILLGQQGLLVLLSQQQ